MNIESLKDKLKGLGMEGVFEDEKIRERMAHIKDLHESVLSRNKDLEIGKLIQLVKLASHSRLLPEPDPEGLPFLLGVAYGIELVNDSVGLPVYATRDPDLLRSFAFVLLEKAREYAFKNVKQ